MCQAAPTEGHHPGESGASCLEYLLRGSEVVPPSLGVFLPTTYRMHPTLCDVVSTLAYRGRLRAHPSAATRTIELPEGREAEGAVAGTLALESSLASLASLLSLAPPSTAAADAAVEPAASRAVAGVAYVPCHHEGNTHSSAEEAALIAALCGELLGSQLVADGRRRPLQPADLLVVAPYNLQVRALEAALPPGVRVGTVDRFQGQEAPVVLLSLCHSDFDGAARAEATPGVVAGVDDSEGGTSATGGGGAQRGLSFVLNLNRLNVALSRAQCLAVVVGSPRLADTTPRTLQQQRELNVLCRIVEQGAVGGSPDRSRPS